MTAENPGETHAAHQAAASLSPVILSRFAETNVSSSGYTSFTELTGKLLTPRLLGMVQMRAVVERLTSSGEPIYATGVIETATGMPGPTERAIVT